MKIKFLPQNVEVKATSGQSVRDIAKEQNLPISSSCNGMCVCAECRVYVVEGENHILPPTEKEVELIGRGYVIDRRRLSCQLFCFGDVTVDLSEQVERAKHQGNITKQVLKKLSKTRPEEVHSVGDVLIEKDQDMKKTTDVFEHSQKSHPPRQHPHDPSVKTYSRRQGQRGQGPLQRGQSPLQKRGYRGQGPWQRGQGPPGYRDRRQDPNQKASGPREEGTKFHPTEARPRTDGTRPRTERGTKFPAERGARPLLQGVRPPWSKKRTSSSGSRGGFRKRTRSHRGSSFGGGRSF